MPDIDFKGKKIHCEPGQNLRKVLLSANVPPYNGLARYLNCHGLGSCGTCAIKIDGLVNEETFMEKWRLSFPPHKRKRGLRLACQVRVWGDLSVKKGSGFWGEKLPSSQSPGNGDLQNNEKTESRKK